MREGRPVIVASDAVVLRAVKYGDTSKIVTLYTLAYGRLAVMAKGARSARSRFGSALEPLSRVRAVFYRTEGRDLCMLSQCDLLRAHGRTADDLDRLMAACAAVELVNAAVHGEEPNPPLYHLLTATLDAVDSATKSPFPALYFYELRLAGLLGFQPDFNVCTACGRDLREEGVAGGYLDAQQGGLLCQKCGSGRTGETLLPVITVRALQHLSGVADPHSALRLTLPRTVEQDAGAAIRRYLKVHIEGLRTSRTDRVAAALRQQE
jgi:DNA repair protein RecO (recombination protein O)